MTSSAIRAAGGASATHGDLALTSKNTDPDSCTADRTSDSASVLIDTTPRRTMALSARPPDPKARSQNGRATTIAGLRVRARALVDQEAHEMSRWLTPAALICNLPMRCRYVGTAQAFAMRWPLVVASVETDTKARQRPIGARARRQPSDLSRVHHMWPVLP